jgi:hypothetical protein
VRAGVRGDEVRRRHDVVVDEQDQLAARVRDAGVARLAAIRLAT